jgi:hypothetical protein
VSSSVGPCLPPAEGSSSSNWSKPWDLTKDYPEPGNNWPHDNQWCAMGSGVIVDSIKTYHMGVALATRQTPFALLKPDNSTPVLVKVVDTKLPGGKQVNISSIQSLKAKSKSFYSTWVFTFVGG